MIRFLRLSSVVLTIVVSLVVPAAVAASDSGASYGACVSMHATTMGGFSGDHNPGMHQGFSNWPGCTGA